MRAVHQAVNRPGNFIGIRNHTAHATVKFNRNAFGDNGDYIVQHLTVAHFDHEETFDLFGKGVYFLGGEWGEADGAQQTDFVTLFAGGANGRKGNPPAVP